MKSKNPSNKNDSVREILEGVDAIGTIVEEDLNYLKRRFGEIHESMTNVSSELTSIRLDQKVLESNQVEILESLKILGDKLDHLEIKMAKNRRNEKTADDFDDDR